MSCSSPVLNFQVGEMIVCFMAKYPKVDVHLESTNRRVDVLREGLDLAIRVRFPPLEETDLVVKQLANSPQQLVASPSLLRGRAQPLVPEDLVTLPGIMGRTARPLEFLISRIS
jgi:DNA-binding transcriptional LysR family regulator